MSDRATGLSITPPPGYSAKRFPTKLIPANENIVASFRVTPKNRKQIHQCLITLYDTGPNLANVTQSEINALFDTGKGIEYSQRTFSKYYDAKSAEPFEHAGVRGFAFVGENKAPRKRPLHYSNPSYAVFPCPTSDCCGARRLARN